MNDNKIGEGGPLPPVPPPPVPSEESPKVESGGREYRRQGNFSRLWSGFKNLASRVFSGSREEVPVLENRVKAGGNVDPNFPSPIKKEGSPSQEQQVAAEKPLEKPAVAAVKEVEQAGRVGIPRRTREENDRLLMKNFSGKLIFIRSFTDPEDELQNTINPKIGVEEGNKGAADKRLWSSASTFASKIPMPIYKEGSKNGERIGLAILPEVPIGGWGPQDMGTDNPPAALQGDPEKLKNYFPSKFPKFAFGDVLKRLGNMDPKVIGDILGKDPGEVDVFFDADDAQGFFLDAMYSDSPNHQTLLDRLPEKTYPEFYPSFDLKGIKEKMEAINEKCKTKGEPISTYNEGKIIYMPNDIVGIWYSPDIQESCDRAEAFQKELEKLGIFVSLFSYNAQDASIQIKEKSILPNENSEQFKALVQKYYKIMTEMPAGEEINTENIKKFLKSNPKYQNTYEANYAKEVEDIDFKKIIGEILKIK